MQACQIPYALHETLCSTGPCPTRCPAALVLHVFAIQHSSAASWDPTHQREPISLIHDVQPAAAGLRGPGGTEKPRGYVAAVERHNFTDGSPFSKLSRTLSTRATHLNGCAPRCLPACLPDERLFPTTRTRAERSHVKS